MAGKVRNGSIQVAIALLVAACAKQDTEPAEQSVNAIDVVIASAVSETARASSSIPVRQSNMAHGSRVRGVVRLLPPSHETEADPQRRVEVRWNGAVEPLVRLTARYFGYTFRTEQDRPLQPIVVNLSLSDATLLEVVFGINRAARGMARVEIGDGPSLNLVYAR
ncbi:MAG: DotD/TraH family lipoprotein [Rhodobacteraceae bacterium]|nr:DotD/TraH family lipoprotein [Paracoccaceae bacterium]